MSYDSDLNPVLEQASNEQLQPIVDAILKASHTESLSDDPKYKQYAPDHSKYTDVIADEIRLFGGHTLVNLFRKEGPAYQDIVKDVAKKLKVEFRESDTVSVIERAILMHMLKDMIKDFTPEQIQQLKNEPNSSEIVRKMLEGQEFDNDALDKLSPSAFVLATTVLLSTAARLAIVGGLGTAAAASAALSFAGGRLLGLLGGPLAWGATIAYGAYELGGEAYRVTIPCVVNVAMLRLYKGSSASEQRYFDYVSQHRLPGHKPDALSDKAARLGNESVQTAIEYENAQPGRTLSNDSQEAKEQSLVGASKPIMSYEEFRKQFSLDAEDSDADSSSKPLSKSDQAFLRTTIKKRS